MAYNERSAFTGPPQQTNTGYQSPPPSQAQYSTSSGYQTSSNGALPQMQAQSSPPPGATMNYGSAIPQPTQTMSMGQMATVQNMNPNAPPPGHDMVSAEQYRYALQNFRIAHEQVEKQRRQLDEQERQVAMLRHRIAVLEGGDNQGMARTNQRAGGQSVDDFSIKNAASKLERLANRWAADVVRELPQNLGQVYDACQGDIGGLDIENPTPALVQNILRHAFSETISEGVINCLIVTNSPETNIQLSRIHDHIFQRDPTVASVWRRQTFSAAVEAFTPEMSTHILSEALPSLYELLTAEPFMAAAPSIYPGLKSILDSAYEFSRMLHASKASSAGGVGGGADAFYKSFVPELGSVLYPRQVELLKRCRKHESGVTDVVGACVFPGLVKVTRAADRVPTAGPSPAAETDHAVVRRAQVICQCALLGFDPATAMPDQPPQM